ncbi:MAG TPA: pyrophosphatase [Mariprofundaceae bacterium]|nr:pyrophosphatase [Mariprofundaceae bacterium]
MKKNNFVFSDYLQFVKDTDRLPKNDLAPVLHGLFGEVGGLMTAAKKIKREPNVYTGFDSVVIEEFGDAFWYLCCLSARLNVDIQAILVELTHSNRANAEILLGSDIAPLVLSFNPSVEHDFDDILVKLGQLTGNFLSVEYIENETAEKIKHFLETYFSALCILNISFTNVIDRNINKISSRFIRPENSSLPLFDDGFPEFERLPVEFEIEFVQRTKEKQAMRWNGVFIGDPLTDSIKDIDGYRFHDVFHFSYAAILSWSPTIRALIKHKRKSNPEIDHTQDGGRAIVVEEGLSAWIFNIAKENNYFEHKKSLTFDMLKNITQIVKGFEVDECPMILWEEAILTGYDVFRNVVKNNGGIIVGNRIDRTLRYKGHTN